ncbi:MAG: FtsL-like putative cell division protein [Bacteroidota bacterium]
MAKKRGIKILDIGFLTSEFLLKHLPFFLFLGFLATIYIANAHFAERNVRLIQEMQKDLKEQRWFYMSLQSENMYNSMRSEMVEKVKDMGLRQNRREPKIVKIDSQ